ncbi:MAG: FtsX-like permease family protein [Spirochaetales bacterium]|nr:FtsX-like permease family protein [Candidatus Physcosoma equi]
MKKDVERIYLGRKLGRGMGVSYTLSSLTPALLILLITTVLVFALVFISSMTEAIDRMIVVLGSGSLRTEEKVDEDLFPGSRVFHVNTGEGILYTQDGESMVRLKGVEEGYFEGEIGERIRLKTEDMEVRNPIVLSRTLAESLHLLPGDKMTLLLYVPEENRTRPFLMTLTGIFDSGYAQIDRYMAYIDYSIIGGEGGYEVFLPKGMKAEKAQGALALQGIFSETYQELYSALYQNVRQSVMILYLILGAVAVLAAFFSTDIAHVYTTRDKKDIGTLRLLGYSDKEIRGIYSKLTLLSLSVAAFLGTVLGLLLGLFSPSLIQLVAAKEPEMVEYYISSFSLTIPWLVILLMLCSMVLCSWLSLSLSLRKMTEEDLSLVILHG